MEVVGDENNAANTFYRIRDVRNAGLTIIAEYNAPDDFFLNNSRDTFLVYSQNKFCLLSFPGAGAAVIRILQNGAWERHDVTLPYDDGISGRDAYFDGEDNLHWVVFINSFHLSNLGDYSGHLALCEYCNVELIANINFDANAVAIVSLQINVMNRVEVLHNGEILLAIG